MGMRPNGTFKSEIRYSLRAAVLAAQAFWPSRFRLSQYSSAIAAKAFPASIWVRSFSH